MCVCLNPNGGRRVHDNARARARIKIDFIYRYRRVFLQQLIIIIIIFVVRCINRYFIVRLRENVLASAGGGVSKNFASARKRYGNDVTAPSDVKTEFKNA